MIYLSYNKSTKFKLLSVQTYDNKWVLRGDLLSSHNKLLYKNDKYVNINSQKLLSFDCLLMVFEYV